MATAIPAGRRAPFPAVVRRDGYAAFAKGDLTALDDLFGADVRWHEPGHHQLSGTHDGRAAVYDHFRRVFELTDGTFRAEPQVFFPDDNHGMVFLRLSGSRGDRPFEVLSTQVLRFARGSGHRGVACPHEPGRHG